MGSLEPPENRTAIFQQHFPRTLQLPAQAGLSLYSVQLLNPTKASLRQGCRKTLFLGLSKSQNKN